MTGRKATCRYLKAYRTQCTGEAVVSDGEVLLCARHLAAAQRLIAAAMDSKKAPRGGC